MNCPLSILQNADGSCCMVGGMNIMKSQTLPSPEVIQGTIPVTGTVSPILGIGPSAHSYNKVSRQWNISNNPQYIPTLMKASFLFFWTWRIIRWKEKFNEYILTSFARSGVSVYVNCFLNSEKIRDGISAKYYSPARRWADWIIRRKSCAYLKRKILPTGSRQIFFVSLIRWTFFFILFFGNENRMIMYAVFISASLIFRTINKF